MFFHVSFRVLQEKKMNIGPWHLAHRFKREKSNPNSV